MRSVETSLRHHLCQYNMRAMCRHAIQRISLDFLVDLHVSGVNFEYLHGMCHTLAVRCIAMEFFFVYKASRA